MVEELPQVFLINLVLTIHSNPDVPNDSKTRFATVAVSKITRAEMRLLLARSDKNTMEHSI